MKQKNKVILGITSIDNFAHDNSIALLKNGKIIFASSEERFSRIKHDGSFPHYAITNALKFLKLKPGDISTIAIGYPKRRSFSVLYNKFFYEPIFFVTGLFINRNVMLLLDLISIIKLIYNKSKTKQADLSKKVLLANKKIVYVDHHLAHAASAYYTSGFSKCISIAMDAFGSDLSGNIRGGAIFLCEDGNIKEIVSVPIFASLGLFYQSVTYSLGFKPGDGEGKTMGLAAYGNYKKTLQILKSYCPRFTNGVWEPNKDWLSGILPCIPKLAYLFKSTKFGKLLDQSIAQEGEKNVAAGAQKLLEEELVKIVKFFIKKYPDFHDICLSGGTFLNVKANKKIMEIAGVDNIFVQPNAGDGGTALGAALTASDNKYLKQISNQSLKSCGLGVSFNKIEILKVLRRYGNQINYQAKNDIVGYTVEKIVKGSVIGWFQGQSEWGPRALGFRSVLADPRKIEVKDRINEVLKNREWFMPFAPSILEEEGKTYFKNFKPSPFMTIVFDVLPQKAKLFPAALHIDNTARPNSVNINNNELYYRLLKKFHKKTGLPILLNTSFNRHGLPIVNSPVDAVEHLLMGAVDELIIGNFAVQKNLKKKQ